MATYPDGGHGRLTHAGRRVGEAPAADARWGDPDADRPHDQCGVFGVFAPGRDVDVARLTYFGIYALQHRGQESAGIAVSDGERIRCHKNMGLVSQVFEERDLARLRGGIAIGHTRYSTTGSSWLCNAQPIMVETPYGPLAVAHNGNIVNTRHLRRQLEEDGVSFESTNDSEVLARCLASMYRGDIVRAVRETMAEVQGAYSVAVLTRNELVGFRDPNGIRPLCVASLNGDGYVISSETCALSAFDARLIREIQPGEVVLLDKEGLSEFDFPLPHRPAMCVFEFIYLARPDSQIYGKSLHAARVRMGQELYHEHPVAGAVVIGVPDTGIPAAIGFSQAAKLEYTEGLIKNRYIGRTFINPEQRMRELGVRMKLSALRESIAGRRVVLVDDSIVRGTTTGQIVRLIREAGATQVHVRISSPPVKWPCFYGIDMAERRELIAARRTVEQIREHIGADSLGYLSVRGLMRAIGMNRDRFCHACFTGEYPIPVPRDVSMTKLSLEEPERRPSPDGDEPHGDEVPPPVDDLALSARPFSG
jgi:amidophosphoribosyltransferase